MKLKKNICKRLALLEIIQNCLSQNNVKKVGISVDSFDNYGNWQFRIIETGFPNLLEKTIPLFIWWGHNNFTYEDNNAISMDLKMLKHIAMVVFDTFKHGKEDFYEVYKDTVEKWFNA